MQGKLNNSYRQYSPREIRADFCLHLIVSAVGVIVLFVIADAGLPATTTVSILIYSLALVAVFSISAGYNFAINPKVKSTLMRLDQAAIYVKIAATYTPFAAVKMGGWSGSGLLIFVWAIAAFGFATKLFYPDRLIRLSYVLYLTQGWAAVFVLDPFVASVSRMTLAMLGFGGVLYTVGVPFHLWTNLRYHKAIWHGFVVCGAACHYAAVLGAITLT